MHGYKTIITAIISVVMGLATVMGVTIDAQLKADIVANLDVFIGAGMTLYGLVMAVLRAFTSSPMLNGKRLPKNSVQALIPVFAVLLVVGLQGCVAQPRMQTPADQVAVAYATINALTNTTKQFYSSGRINKQKKDEIAADLREALTSTKIAEDLLLNGRPKDAVQSLLVVNNVLLILEQRIQEKSP